MAYPLRKEFETVQGAFLHDAWQVAAAERYGKVHFSQIANHVVKSLWRRGVDVNREEGDQRSRVYVCDDEHAKDEEPVCNSREGCCARQR